MISRRKDGYGSESKEKETGPQEDKLSVPEFSRLFDSLEFEYGTEWGSESEEPVHRGLGTLPLYLPLFQEYFYFMQFKYN
jgi:hypothetical protein